MWQMKIYAVWCERMVDDTGILFEKLVVVYKRWKNVAKITKLVPKYIVVFG